MKNNESGRSMVEMLGVLAIIGVLSIGGIAGYTMAMRRYRANEVINAAAKLAVLNMALEDGGTAITTTDLGINSLPGGCTLTGTAGSGTVALAGCTDDTELVATIETIAGDNFNGSNSFTFAS